MKRIVFLLLGLLAIASHAIPANAHALEPGYLQLEFLGGDRWKVFWRKPAVGNRPMQIDPRLPRNCEPRTAPEARFDGRAYAARWIAHCPGGLAGGEIAIAGLASTQTDVLVRYETVEGKAGTKRLTADEASFGIAGKLGPFEVGTGYFSLGVDHILEGYDHLLFVFALMLLIRTPWRLVGAITAFTLAHSLTLAAAVLGWIVVPTPPVEAVIALSIMFLAAELAQRDASRLRFSERYPWIVAFGFGLLHGLGFARALLDIGLPEGELPLALLAFNLGVEVGQLIFVALCIVTGAVLMKLLPVVRILAQNKAGPAMMTTAYAIGGISAFWFIERVAGFWA